MLCYRGSDNQLSFCSCLAGAGVRAFCVNKYAASHTRANHSSLNRSMPFHSHAILANRPRTQGILRLVLPCPSTFASRISCTFPSRIASLMSFPASRFRVSLLPRLVLVSSRFCLVSHVVSSRVCLVLSRAVGLLLSWSLGLLVSWTSASRSCGLFGPLVCGLQVS